MNLPPLYLLSGLGADERLFTFLHLQHPNPKVLQWVTPAPEDTLATYASKLIGQIAPYQEPPVLVGLSFGGMVMQEIAKQIPVKRVILLSSLANTQELPVHYRLAGALKMQHWAPLSLGKKWLAPAQWIFGAHTPAEKKILSDIIREIDMFFLRWSLKQILNWRHTAIGDNVVIIHGDADKILPLPRYPQVHVIKGGEHLMVMSRAAEVSALINRYLL